MKSFKKALAAFLAVLMVVFSVPFTAAANDSWDPVVSLHVYAYNGDSTWGPFDANDSNTDMAPEVDALEAGKDYVVCFVLTGITGFQMIQLRTETAVDDTMVQPVYYYTQKNKEKITFPDYGTIDDVNSSMLLGMEAVNVGTGTTIVDNPSYWAENELVIAKTNGLTPTTLSGTTTYVDAFNPSAPDDYDGTITLDGTLLNAIGMRAMKDMTVAELYNAFDFRLNDILNNFVRDEDKVDHNLKFEPDSTTPPAPSTVTYTYTFANGSTTEVTVNAGETPTAPDNTADTAWANLNATQHAKTTYAWAADGDNAFVEQGSQVTENHAFSETTPATTGNCVTDGTSAVETCSVCNATKGGESTGTVADGHNMVPGDVHPATCTERGWTDYTCANGCGETAKANWTGPNGHTMTATAANAATCTEPGNTAYWTCSACDKVFADEAGEVETTLEATVIPAAGHTMTATAAKAANCTEAGNTAYWTCSACDKVFADEAGNTEIALADTVIPAKGHTMTATAAKEATRGEAGNTAYWTCDVCDKVFADEAGDTEIALADTVIPALGVNITVEASALGSATINGEAIAGATKNVAYCSNYTLVATPAPGAEFYAWTVGNKIVSTEPTYTTNARADMTYVPVFVDAAAGEFVITFRDYYGNVIATVSSADLPLAALPEIPQYAGLVDAGWTKTLDEVNAMTAAGDVYAIYDNDNIQKFTVTAAGCTIIVDGNESQGTASAAYNSLVTVKAPEGVTVGSWSANGAEASYDAEYTFYCGSDITVTYDETTVTAAPTIVSVSAYVAAGNNIKFLATRSVAAADWTLVESGYIYGKAMNVADLVLEKVGKVAGTDNGKVKQAVCTNKGEDGQFALTYGVSAGNQNACARPYVIAKTATGTQVFYGAAMIYNYGSASASFVAE